MAHEIVERTVQGETDKRAVIDNAHSPLARKMKIGSDWTQLRVAMRISTTVAEDRTSVPYFYFGLMSGTGLMPWSGAGVHFFGVRSNTQKWQYIDNAGSNFYAKFAVNSSLIVGATETTAALGAQTSSTNQPLATINTVARSFFMVEITKGAPWTLKTWWNSGYSGNNADRNITPQIFKELVQSTTKPSYMIENTTTDYTPNEAVDGVFDSVFFGSLDASDSFEVSDIAYARLA